MIIAFFGHAKFRIKEEYERRILAFLEETVACRDADIYLGSYGNFDDFAYECCKKYKKTHPRVTLVLITPYMTVEYQKNHLEYQKTRYDLIIYPEIEDKPLKYAISYRNKWMIDKADYIVFGVEHDWGGAYKAYKYAKGKRKALFNVMNDEFC